MLTPIGNQWQFLFRTIIFKKLSAIPVMRRLKENFICSVSFPFWRLYFASGSIHSGVNSLTVLLMCPFLFMGYAFHVFSYSSVCAILAAVQTTNSALDLICAFPPVSLTAIPCPVDSRLNRLPYSANAGISVFEQHSSLTCLHRRQPVSPFFLFVNYLSIRLMTA